jgi:MoaA/NifB/PqqE/SkfB family radical SAM enzyme
MHDIKTSKPCLHSTLGISLGSANGNVTPCCNFKSNRPVPNIFELETLNDIHSDERFKQVSDSLNNGVWPLQCGRCEASENSKFESRRHFTDKFFKKYNILFKPGYIQDLEIALDYTCNMMCRICEPSSSSKWSAAKHVIEQFDEHNIELGMGNALSDYQTQFYKVFSNTDLSYARHVKILGGEPFYAKHFEWFLNKLDNEVKEKDKLFLNIITNGSVFPTEKVLNQLSQFDTSITFSLDGMGDLATCTRWGVDWTVIEKNIRHWTNYKNKFDLMTNTTISMLNVNMLSPLRDFCSELGIRLFYSELTTPEYLSIYQLPVSVRKRWLTGNDYYDEFIKLDITIEPNFKKLLKSIEILDAYQGINFHNVNPEMYELIKEWASK